VRSGGVYETLKYDHGVSALQFDTRKIVTATGENGIKVYAHPIHDLHILSAVLSFALQIYNRTTMQHSTLRTNGHTRPVGRLRYMDRYLTSGGRDSTVKIWTL
jgi:division protein 1